MAEGTRPCAIIDCPRPTGVPGSARGWCGAHYQRWQRHGDPLGGRTPGRSQCSVKACVLLVVSHGYCATHWSRVLRRGSATPRLQGEIVDGRRICPRCKVDRSVSEYSPSVYRTSGLAAHCKPCVAAKQAVARTRPGFERSPRNPETDRRYGQAYRARHPDRIRSHSATRRGRKKRGAAERFLVGEIFERDSWTCHICTDPIDRGLKYPDPMSVSLDHVIPLSRGGIHTRGNCAASHLLCNMRKKDRMGVGRNADHGGEIRG